MGSATVVTLALGVSGRATWATAGLGPVAGFQKHQEKATSRLEIDGNLDVDMI